MSQLREAARGWSGRHLLGLEELPAEALEALLQTAEFFRQSNDEQRQWDFLKGKVVINLFFEDSTRTRTSFALAARKLSANVVEFSSKSSSLSKGESFTDTARNLEALGADIVVVRHKTPGTPHLLGKYLNTCVLNAGDGAHEHPTQGLLDLLTVRQVKGSCKGLNVVLVGDIAHSRVARSNIWGLQKLGAHVIVCGPKTLVPRHIERLGVEVSHDLDEVIPRCDVVNILRIQFERQRTGLFPSIREYAHLFGVDDRRLSLAKPDVLILAPGPINRGVEISSGVADGPNSRILQQVSNGLAVRMAAMYLVAGQGMEESA
ncbi:aspartate carbamoyltransferase catalytic subunit [Kolteria novifilia]|uniref:aspartate carbamoyltransferase catalytic subunit n=1 Tax=Kolteria novifilia TaxID=2527975 RepID=UPI003AF3FEE8